jgi:hypothetical protein
VTSENREPDNSILIWAVVVGLAAIVGLASAQYYGWFK